MKQSFEVYFKKSRRLERDLGHSWLKQLGKQLSQDKLRQGHLFEGTVPSHGYNSQEKETKTSVFLIRLNVRKGR